MAISGYSEPPYAGQTLFTEPKMAIQKMRWLGFIVLIVLAGCKKGELGPQHVNAGSVENGAVLILNEGNFGWGNGSISQYDPTSGEVGHQVFENANGYALGDVAQSVAEIHGHLFVVINNSGKVEVLSPATLQVEQTISGLTSPRFVAEAGVSKAYITDLYSNHISVVDLQNYSVSSQIYTGTWTENILPTTSGVLVGCPDNGVLLKIDPATDQVVGQVQLTKGVGAIVEDLLGSIWVLCDGGQEEEIPVLYKIDPVTMNVLDQWSFPSVMDAPSNLVINGGKTHVYFTNTHIYRMSIYDPVLPTNPLVSGTNRTWYELGIDPTGGEVYASDVKDYVQQSVIHRLDSLGNSLDVFNGGVISGAFYFY